MEEQMAEALARAALPHWGGAADWGGAAHCGGAAQTALRCVAIRENAVFHARLPGGEVALRLHRPGYHSRDAVGEELDICARLAAAGLPVPVPVPCTNGRLTALVGGHVASALRWIPGAAPGAEAGAGTAEGLGLWRELGACLAALHATADRCLGAIARPPWDGAALLGAQPRWGRWQEAPDLAPAEAAELRALGARLAAALAGRRGDVGLIHGDPIPGNLLRAEGRLVLLDFDDCGAGDRLLDLAGALVGAAQDREFERIAQALVEGYAALRPVDAAALPLFVAARGLASAGWALSRTAPGDARRAAYARRALDLARRALPREAAA